MLELACFRGSGCVGSSLEASGPVGVVRVRVTHAILMFLASTMAVRTRIHAHDHGTIYLSCVGGETTCRQCNAPDAVQLL